MNLRRLLVLLATFGLAAGLLTPGAWAGHDNDGAPTPDPDAGSDAGPTAAPTPAPGAGTTATSTVSDEAEYRAALLALSANASGPHVIEIAASFVVDDGTDPEYTNTTEALTIEGNGFTVTSGAADQRFLAVPENVDLVVNDLTVVGFVTGGSGGAINADGNIEVNRSTFTGNDADNDGGAIDVQLEATINSSTFVDNNADDGDGGAIDTSDTGSAITATDSTFRGNFAGGDGGALSAEDDVSATGSTFVGNQAEEGAALDAGGSATLVNSTVTGNTGEFDIVDGTGDETGVGDVTLIYVTIADNIVEEADEGAVDSDEDGVLTAFATTISGTSTGTNCEPGDFSSVVSSYSRSDDGSCGFTGTGDVENAGAPGLGALADNGGPTETMLPQSGSPLIDAIPEGDCDATVTDDQRDITRPQDGDLDGTPACDVGAVEVEGTLVPAPVPEPEPGPITATPTFTG